MKTPYRWLCMATAYLSCPLVGNALLVDESFALGGNASAGEYTTNNVYNQAPTVTGFTGPWIITAGGGPAVSGSTLIYADSTGTVDTTGGSLIMGSNNSRAARQLSASLDNSSSGTYYLSFVYKQASDLAGYRRMGLYDGGVGSSYRELSLGADSSTDGKLSLSAFGNTVSEFADVDNNAVFFVMRFDMSTTPGGDSFTLYVNPGLETEPGSGIVNLSGLDISFDHFGLERYTYASYTHDFSVDEIRMATNYDDVTPSNVVYAGVVYEDDFDRPDNDALGFTPFRGKGWIETEGSDDSVRIDSDAIRVTSVDPGGAGARFYVDRDLDELLNYTIEATLDLSQMNGWTFAGSGLWLLPRAQGNDLPGNRGWYLRMVDITATDSISVYQYDGAAADGNGSITGTELTSTVSERLDRDKLIDVLIEVNGNDATLTLDQSPYGGGSYTASTIDVSGGSGFADNGVADVFLIGAHQVQTGNRDIDASIDDVVVSAYAGAEIPNKSVVLDYLDGYRILLEHPSPEGLEMGAGKAIFDQMHTAYLNSNITEFNAYREDLQNWFAAVVAWHAAKEDYTHRMLHGQNYSAAQSYLDSALALINNSQSAGVKAELANLVPLQDAAGAPPVSYTGGENRWGWIKSFDTMGFRHHPDLGENLEPDPWLSVWEETHDGWKPSNFSFLREDPSYDYVFSRTIKQIPYSEAHFNNVPNNHVFTHERNWTTTHWLHDDGWEVIYSVLTPLVLFKNTDEFYLRIPIASWTEYPEVIQQLWVQSGGSYTAITPSTTTLPTIDSAKAILETTDGYYLIVIPEYVDDISITDRELIIETQSATNFAFHKLQGGNEPDGANPSTWPYMLARVDFWTSVALDCPVSVGESMQGNTVTYDYNYLTTSSVHGETSQRIAPVPALAVLADLSITGVQTTSFNIATSEDYGDYEYVTGSQVSFDIPAITHQPLHGANVPIDRTVDYEELAAYGVKVARLYQASTTDRQTLKDMFEDALAECEANGIKAIIDPHTALYRMSYNDIFVGQELQDYIDWWVELATLAQPYKDILAGYDFYNEPPLDRGSLMDDWVAQAQLVSDAIVNVDPDTLHYVSAISYGGADGLWYQDTEMPDPLMRPTFHFYTPYSFTHQKVPQQTSDAPNTYYPFWVPGVDHGNDHYGSNREPTFYDKWNVGAAMMPVLEYLAKYNSDILLGEFSPLGYSRSGGSQDGAAVWNQHVIEWASRFALDTTLWAYHGSGLEHPEVADQMIDFWGLQTGMQLNAADITAYGSGQNGQGGHGANFTLSADKRAITLTGNSWYKFALPEGYTMTPNTMLDVTFSSNSIGELHGIGLDENNYYGDHDRAVLLYGTQGWNGGIAINSADNYSNFAPDEMIYSIPIGSFYNTTNTMDYLIFVNDDDTDGSGVSVFSNIRIYEN